MTRNVEQPEGEPAVPESVKLVHAAIEVLTDAFCRGHLNEECRALCHRLTEALARTRPSPLFRSMPHTWACVIVRVIGQAPPARLELALGSIFLVGDAGSWDTPESGPSEPFFLLCGGGKQIP